MRKMASDVTCRGRPFQTRRAATGNARSATVDDRGRRTVSDDDEAERVKHRCLTRDSVSTRPSVCLSVRSSRSGDVSKRLNICRW